MAEGPDWATIVAAIAAAFAATAALAVPITTFWRRPRLAIEEDVRKIRSRVKGNGLPYVRLLVSNRERRRAAHGTRALVQHYREQRIGSPAVTMGGPLLGWPSAVAETGGTVVFAGDARPA